MNNNTHLWDDKERVCAGWSWNITSSCFPVVAFSWPRRVPSAFPHPINPSSQHATGCVIFNEPPQHLSDLIRLCRDSQNKNPFVWHSRKIPLCRNMTSPVRSIWLLLVPPHTKEHYFSFNSSCITAFGVCLCERYLMNMYTHRWTHPMWLVRNEISSSRRTCVDSCTLLLNFCRGKKEETSFTAAFI